MTNDPTVLFCVGATKAGTSWFHRFLAGHPDCRMRSVKELHYFDALTPDVRLSRVAKHIQAQNRISAGLDNADPAALANKLRQISDREHLIEVFQTEEGADEAYLQYLHGSGGTEKLVGDVTPSYSLLDAGEIQRMANLAQDVRFLYLLRDPIDRLWSHIRMVAGRNAPNRQLTRENADMLFDSVLAGRVTQISVRSDYRSAIEKLRAFIMPAKLKFAFFEDLFSNQSIANICDFLGISRQPAPMDRVVHRGGSLQMLDEQRMRAREWLASQYDFVQANFDTIPAQWQFDLKKVQA